MFVTFSRRCKILAAGSVVKKLKKKCRMSGKYILLVIISTPHFIPAPRINCQVLNNKRQSIY